jgi:type IV secretion system protein VirB11
VLGLLSDPGVQEVYVNPGRKGEPLPVWTDGRAGKVCSPVLVSEQAVQQFLSVVATGQSGTLTRDEPHIQAELPHGAPFHGARLQGLVPPVVSQATFVIRKHGAAVLSLDDYVEAGSMTPAQRAAISAAVVGRENVVVAGGTGSGKTTLTNAVLQEVARRSPRDRIVVLEDTPELRCTAEDALHMRTSPEVPMKRLVYLTLRCTPDRIVVGEVRDDAAYDLLDAWATGHPGGVCTVHAETPLGALSRLHRLAGHGEPEARHRLIAESVGFVVVVEKRHGRRRIAAMVRVLGWSPEGGYDLEAVVAGPTPPPVHPPPTGRAGSGGPGLAARPGLAGPERETGPEREAP